MSGALGRSRAPLWRSIDRAASILLSMSGMEARVPPRRALLEPATQAIDSIRGAHWTSDSGGRPIDPHLLKRGPRDVLNGRASLPNGALYED